LPFDNEALEIGEGIREPMRRYQKGSRRSGKGSKRKNR
jgi:hypothetical protein